MMRMMMMRMMMMHRHYCPPFSLINDIDEDGACGTVKLYSSSLAGWLVG